MVRSFEIRIDTIGGEMLDEPMFMQFPCDTAIPMGYTTIRGYDSVVENIVAMNVFLIKYGSNVYGTMDFKSLTDFLDYRNGICVCCDDGSDKCGLYLNGCLLLLNGCSLVLAKDVVLAQNILVRADDGTPIVTGDGQNIVVNP